MSGNELYFRHQTYPEDLWQMQVEEFLLHSLILLHCSFELLACAVHPRTRFVLLALYLCRVLGFEEPLRHGLPNPPSLRLLSASKPVCETR